ncbi:MAG TPA: endonuclease/exonuclease/phosphatase family protein [Bacteroidia bacterium]|nr:endonuclease/exonuclease/phosphatase family protein [Bacteroidia bacterium]HNU33729.1 endonuclease/exonuclease/phosphatase family protein [Bacteroidia bacterium]
MPFKITAPEQEPRKKKYTLFSFLRFIISWSVLISTLLACLAPYVNPQKVWFIALFGLGFVYLYLLNIILLVINIVRKRKILFLHLMVFLFGIRVFLNHFNFSTSNPSNNDGINLLTYNVRVFDLYNWSKNLETKAEMFELIKNQNPSIVCFQEFYSSTIADYRNLDSLKQLLQLNEVHTLFPVFLYGTDYFGVVTMTNLPVIRKETVFHNKAQSNGAICTDVVLNDKDTVRIYNVHLQSIRFKPEDYKFIKSVELSADQKQIDGLEGVMTRLKKAFVLRASQVNLIAEHITKSPYPVMIVGDFNDTPASYTYNKLSDKLIDAFEESGKGLSTTYNGAFPAFRIDYILHDKRITSSDYRVIKKDLSDHYPVVCNISVK